MKRLVDLPSMAAALAASMIAADGSIDEAEKTVASVVGSRMVPGFSPRLLEELLDDVDALPGASQLALSLREMIDEDAKQVMMNYLIAIARADDRVVEFEAQELKDVARALGLDTRKLEL
jgi:uncharacterized tellurite resistance protein B-like protein